MSQLAFYVNSSDMKRTLMFSPPAAQAVAENVSRNIPIGTTGFDASDDGTLIYLTGGEPVARATCMDGSRRQNRWFGNRTSRIRRGQLGTVFGLKTDGMGRRRRPVCLRVLPGSTQSADYRRRCPYLVSGRITIGFLTD